MADPSAEAFARAMLATYECPAETCGDRRVLKLTADEAMQALHAALIRARAEGRREMQRVAATTCLAVIAEERFGVAQSARECFHRLRSLKDEDIAGILTEARETYEFFNGDTLAKETDRG